MTDNMESDSVNLTDNTPDITLELADDRQNIDNFSKISILDLMEKYNIGRDPLYKRMNYLRIKTYKISGKAHLDAGQVAEMDALHNHIKATGRMEGYPVPEPSGPKDEQPETTTLTVAETQQIDTIPPQQVNYTSQTVRPSTPIDDVDGLITNAQGKATAVIVAENTIARHYIDNPHLLPEHLKAKIAESAKAPAIDPLGYANSLIAAAMGSINAA
ncbi:hypothetical protein I8748_20205 [Nostoc sp. CENA67]|uniref:Uncharacterized protein n=1 Tax=Amazonocrinis nigriterrae CENA67 TaxID=2794033 RepID=A0A8J7HRQ9_9NOST|nr:hypothetical protein [Amazonocrinis nigriterrae]MBH8564477.1 hypothetical protein [Amazonocrinis nigriterrae CENA67]